MEEITSLTKGKLAEMLNKLNVDDETPVCLSFGAYHSKPYKVFATKINNQTTIVISDSKW